MKNQITLFLALIVVTTLSANNVSVTSPNLTGVNATDNYVMVQFDLSWENSWHTSSFPNKWDAAWVFVKYRVGNGEWQHAWLNNTGHIGTGAIIDAGLLNPREAFNTTTNPAVGVFIYRSASGSGNFSITGAQLRWNYGANSVADGATLDIKVFAIEMVYVPHGAFTVGSGGTESGSFTNGSWTSGATVALSISSESALTIAHSAGNLWGTSSSGNNTIGGDGTLSFEYPKGYAGFYCMKYEISQQQYVDFLNSLTPTQASNRYSSGNTGSRYGISVLSGVYSTTNPYVACNYLSWMDGAAYSDWAGLRPMTELEFEKACRGISTPIENEYAWGNTNALAANNIYNGGAYNETTNTSGANAVFNFQPNIQGPMRVGVFAKSTTIRAEAGATYYGIMEMSGNLWERTVTVGNAAGRSYTGLHGDGVLNSSGEATVDYWPGINGNSNDGTANSTYGTTGVTQASGSGFRGGGWYDDATYVRVSARYEAAGTSCDREAFCGFRAVRTKQLAIGDNYGGGIIAHILRPTDPGYVDSLVKGLIAATADQSPDAAWGCRGTLLYGADGTAIGTGLQNTIDIMAGCATAGIAARLCRDVIIYGYSDWYLPSKDELNLMFVNLKAHGLGGFSADVYWSSSEYSTISAWVQYFTFGHQDKYLKDDNHRVRAVRTFPALPAIITTAVSDITSSTANSGGEVTNAGDGTVTARGVCWSTAHNPVCTGDHTTEGSGTGSFISSLANLTASTTYFVRAYATSSLGTAYGNEVSFTTSAASCFIAGTKISMADGTVKNVEDIMVGDEVKSVNTETMEIVIKTVTNTMSNPPAGNLTKIIFSNGQTNTNTKEHPYWVVGKGWSCVDPEVYKNSKAINVAFLLIGDQCLILENGNLVTVTITAIEDQPLLTVPSFNVKVYQTNCYFANGILVHNKP